MLMKYHIIQKGIHFTGRNKKRESFFYHCSILCIYILDPSLKHCCIQNCVSVNCVIKRTAVHNKHFTKFSPKTPCMLWLSGDYMELHIIKWKLSLRFSYYQIDICIECSLEIIWTKSRLDIIKKNVEYQQLFAFWYLVVK